MWFRKMAREISWRLPFVPERALPALRSLDAKSMLRLAEEAAETTYTVVRLAILVALIILFVADQDVHWHSDIGTASLGLYGVVTLVSLIIAWRRAFRPWVPYALVTLDVVLVGTHLAEMARDFGLPPATLFGIPASGLLFLILAHATLRFRPALVVFAAVISLLLIASTGWIPSPADGELSDAVAVATRTNAVMYWQVFPAAVVVLMAGVLWLVSLTTSRLLDRSIAYARRAGRLSRYFSPNLVDRLAGGDQDLRLAARRCTAAVLFVDIHGFTALAEKLQPERVSALLSEFRSIVAGQIFAYEGTVDKFIGDAVMAVFGMPETREDDGQRAVRCGLALLGVLGEWREHRAMRGEEPINVSMGGHYGDVFAGAIGDEQLLEFTVLGDTVNVADQLQKLCSELGRSFVVSEMLFKASAADPASWEMLPRARLPGRAQEISAYAFLYSQP